VPVDSVIGPIDLAAPAADRTSRLGAALMGGSDWHSVGEMGTCGVRASPITASKCRGHGELAAGATGRGARGGGRGIHMVHVAVGRGRCHGESVAGVGAA
jgi:hypothetical protein